MKDKKNNPKQPLVIRTPDHRLRVFVSSTLRELADERAVVRQAILNLRLAPVMFESGARPHPAQKLYRAYLTQSHVFIGIYWQSYGWIAPGMNKSGLEDEFDLAKNMPCLIYIKNPAPEREPALEAFLDKIRDVNTSSYKYFSTLEELRELVENDLVLLLTEYFESARGEPSVELKESILTNVPIPRNPLIGRERELETACNLLLREDVALVTITGPAGIGKSRLGIQVALNLQGHFKDGVFLVSLESVRDPDLVIPTIAKTLGVSETSGEPPLIELFQSYLSNKDILLFLDNFEQVRPAAPQVMGLLESCPKAKVLATSRAPLHLRAEKELLLPPLATPSLEHGYEDQPLSQYSAVQMFIQRAQSIRPEFQVTSENARAVAEICSRLDGLPLALELAAARIRMLSPQALLVRLERRFDVLRGGTRDLPERQHTLYGAIDWSYNLLGEDEKCLLRRLSVFTGSWNIEAAEFICGAEGEQKSRVYDGLESLIDNNLLMPPEEMGGDLRLKTMETIREFAFERLKESGEAITVQERHARYFLTLAELIEDETSQVTKQAGYRRLDLELDNVRTAKAWASEKFDAEYILRLCSAMGKFWEIRGYKEGRAWIEQALAFPSQVSIPLRIKALKVAGRLAYEQMDYTAAQRFYEQGLALSQDINDISEGTSLLNNLGNVAWARGNYERASELYNEVLRRRREQNDEQGIASVLNNLGLLAWRQGQLKDATRYMEESSDITRRSGNKQDLANTLFNLGMISIRMEDGSKRAASQFAESIELSREVGYRKILAYALNNLAMVSLQAGDVGQSNTLAQESLDLCRMQEDRLGAFYALIVLNHGAVDGGDPTRGASLLDQAWTFLEEIKVFSGITCREELSWFLHGVVHLAISLGKGTQAVQLAGADSALCDELAVQFPPGAKAYYETILSKARSRLGEEEYLRIWAEGKTMSSDQAAQQARQIIQGKV